MKHLLLSLYIMLITFPAFAEGRGYDNGGCTAEQTDTFCSMIGFLLAGFIVLVIVDGIWHNHKMKTDPAYRARDYARRREDEERRRNSGY